MTRLLTNTFVCLLVLGAASTANAQFYRYVTNYYQMRQAFLEGYPNTDQDTTSVAAPSDVEGTEFTQFRRWDNLWGPRLWPHGRFSIARDAIQRYLSEVTPSSREYALQTAQWQELGPRSNTVGGLEGVGQITSLAFDPVDPAHIIYAGAPRGGVWKTLDGGQSWINLNTDQALARLGVSTIAIDPIVNGGGVRNIYVGTGEVGSPNSFSDGVYRSQDGGLTWSAINSGLFNALSGFNYIPRLLVDPSNSGVMFAATSVGIFRTANRQASSPLWVRVYIGPSTTSPEWMRSVIFAPGSTTTLYASGLNVIRSTNGGNSWSSIAVSGSGLDLTGTPSVLPQFPGQYMADINIAVSADNKFLYASIQTRGSPPPFNWQTASTPHFFQYDIASQLWAAKTAVDNSRMPIAVHPSNNELVLVGNVNLWRTLNNGSNWSPVYSCAHSDYQAIAFAPNNSNVVYAGTDGGVWRLTFTGNTVSACEQLNNGLGVAALSNTSSSIYDPYQILVGSQDMATSYHKGGQWTVHSEMWGDGAESAMDHADINYMYATEMPNGQNGVLFRASSAASPYFSIINKLNQCNLVCNTPSSINCAYPTTVSSCNPWCEGALWGAPLALDPTNSNILYQGRVQLWRTLNARTAGQSCSDWQKVSDFITDFGQGPYQAITAIAIAPSDPGYLYVAANPDAGIVGVDPNAYEAQPHLYRSTAGGGPGDWSEITPSPIGMSTLPGIITGIAVSDIDPNRVWISFSGYVQGHKVYYSADGGATWSNYSAFLPNLPVNAIVFEKGIKPNLYVGTDVGVYYNFFSNPKWAPFMNGLPNVPVSWLQINYAASKIRAATFGRGLWEADLVAQVRPCTARPLGMVTWWPLDERTGGTAHDIAGGRDGKPHPGGIGGGGPAPVGGKVDGAVEFNAISTFVEVPDGSGTLSFGNPGQNLSLDAWIKADAGDICCIRPIVDKRLQIGDRLWGYAFYLFKGRLGFQLADGAHSGTTCAPAGSSCTNYVSNADVADGQWHHVAVTIDRTSLSPQVVLYDNAKVVFTGVARTGTLNNSAALLIGRGYPIGGGAPYFKGAIDELEIFGRVLTQPDIDAIYGAGSAGKCK
jgi:hypothetical protein